MNKVTYLTFIIVASLLVPPVHGNGHSESEIFSGTFLGGSSIDMIKGVDLDSQGNIIVVGGTFSSDFPVRNAEQETYGGGELPSEEYFRILGDAFVAKFSPSLELLWATYLGGAGLDDATQVLVGAGDEIMVIGLTTSTDFPVTQGSAPTGTELGETFIAVYSPGGELTGARLYYPDEIDVVTDVKLDSSGNIVMGGMTGSPTMYTTEDALSRELSGESDGYIRVVSFDLETVIYSTYIGGSGAEYLGEVAVGLDSSIYATLSTGSRDFPVTENCLRSEFLGDETDNAIIKISPDKELAASTYFGGSGMDHIFDLCEGPGGSMVFVGRSWSSDYPVTSGALQSEYSDVEVDGTLSMISGSGEELLYSTYYGRDGWDTLSLVDMDDDGRLVISGFVDTGGFETVNAFQPDYYGATELVIMIYGDDFELISYLGGYGYDYSSALKEQDGVLYLVGQTSSAGFMVSDDAYQSEIAGAEDGYIWTMDYGTYLSMDHEADQGGSGALIPDLRNYIAYGFVLLAILVWALYMRRYSAGGR